jgi:hypothetical protein
MRSLSPPATPKHVSEWSDDEIAEFETPVINAVVLFFMQTFDNHYTDEDLFAGLTKVAFNHLHKKYPGRNTKNILNLYHKMHLTEQV